MRYHVYFCGKLHGESHDDYISAIDAVVACRDYHAYKIITSHIDAGIELTCNQCDDIKQFFLDLMTIKSEKWIFRAQKIKIINGSLKETINAHLPFLSV